MWARKWRVGITHCQIGRAYGIALGGWEPCLGGRRKKVSPVAGAERGHSSHTRGPWTPSTYTTSSSPDYETTMLACFLHLAFFIAHPSPLSDFLAPSLPPGDTSAVTISPDKGSGILPKASGGGSSWSSIRQQATVSVFPLALFIMGLGLLCSFFPFLLSYLQYMGFRL